MTIHIFEISETDEGRKEWLAFRRKHVTGSNIAALFGCHPTPKRTLLRAYLEKRDPDLFADDDDESENPTLRRGRWLEPAVAKAVTERRPNWIIEKAHQYYWDDQLKLGATPDFYIYGDPRGRGLLETKSVAPAILVRDWESGTLVPFYTVLQTLTGCLLSGCAFGVAAALTVDPHKMDVFILEIPRHNSAEAKIVATVKQFWHSVEFGVEPTPDFGRDSETIKALTRREQAGKQLDLSGNNAIREMLAQRAALMARIKADELRCEEIENEVKFIMRDAELVTGLNGWRVTFKTGERSGYTVPPKTLRTLRITDKRPPEERPDQGDVEE